MSCAGPAVAQRKAPSRATADPQITAAMKEVSAVRIRATIEKMVSFYTRSTLSAADPAAVASGRGIGAAREWIRAEFERYSKACGGCLEVRMDSYVQQPADRISKPTEIVNVVATLPGSDAASAGRIVIVTGHYDSRNSDNFDGSGSAPGANDDASGTAVSLECARVLSKYKFPATIMFLAVAGEEQGLYGSTHFAKDARSKGLNIEAVLNNDIVGGNRTPGDAFQEPGWVRVFSEGIPATAISPAAPEGSATASNAATGQLRSIRAQGTENDSPSRELARYIREIAFEYSTSFAPVVQPRGGLTRESASRPFQPKLVFRPDRYLRGGDHTPFNEQGYAAVRLTEYREDYNHQHQNPRTENGIEYGDLAKFVDFDYVANVARLNAATLASLASAPAPPARVRLETAKLENDSTLVWEPSPSGAVARYEVLWRTTTAPEWENFEPVGNVGRATLPRSKDNVIFAVRALDRAGHASLPVVPER
ncbi:MAG: M20/M25/M40 family metallo-hydrolase [Acidobacteria bacterium]|nr:M20/M25/M40 family metallo-hydrolase [Acidobacteriota bacterium]